MRIYMGWINFALLVAGAVITAGVVDKVVMKNFFANVYPPEADSTSIPVMGAYFTFILLIPFASVISFVSLAKFDANRKFPRTRFWFKVFSYFLSYLIVSLTLLGYTGYWDTPHHEEIRQSYNYLLILVQVIAFYGVLEGILGYVERRKLTK